MIYTLIQLILFFISLIFIYLAGVKDRIKKQKKEDDKKILKKIKWLEKNYIKDEKTIEDCKLKY